MGNWASTGLSLASGGAVPSSVFDNVGQQFTKAVKEKDALDRVRAGRDMAIDICKAMGVSKECAYEAMRTMQAGEAHGRKYWDVFMEQPECPVPPFFVPMLSRPPLLDILSAKGFTGTSLFTKFSLCLKKKGEAFLPLAIVFRLKQGSQLMIAHTLPTVPGNSPMIVWRATASGFPNINIQKFEEFLKERKSAT